MRNADGDVIYIGKALDLKSRMSSYFTGQKPSSPWIRSMVDNIHDFEFILTGSGVEALVLESNLIKKHRPRYNIFLKDDKTYPWIKISVKEEFPRIFPTRSYSSDDGERYFGPYTSVRSMRNTLKLLKRLFPVRECRHSKPGRKSGRVCLNYHIGRCLGPCAGKVSAEKYRELIQMVILFLQGKNREVLRMIDERMEGAVKRLQYEEAAGYRDRKVEIEKILVRQHVYLSGGDDIDVLALEREGEHFCVSVFRVREGKILGRNRVFGMVTSGRDEGEIMAGFIKQYYLPLEEAPAEILVSHMPGDLDEIVEWLRSKAGRKVDLRVPMKGEKRDLLALARSDSIHALGENLLHMEGEKSAEELLEGVKKDLALSSLPRRIDGYDISNLGESNAVASRVVFLDGKPAKRLYRRFRIRGVVGQDDFAMIGEVLERSFGRIGEGEEEKPDLVVVDGGKGQLQAARRGISKLGFDEQEICSISKEEERIHFPGNRDSLLLPRHSATLRLIQRVRDESHRFALAYHSRLRRREMLRSSLEEIAGIGRARRRALLGCFDSLEELQSASLESLQDAENIGAKTALLVYNHFHPTTGPDRP